MRIRKTHGGNYNVTAEPGDLRGVDFGLHLGLVLARGGIEVWQLDTRLPHIPRYNERALRLLQEAARTIRAQDSLSPGRGRFDRDSRLERERRSRRRRTRR